MHINTNPFPFLHTPYAKFLTTVIMLGVVFLWHSLVLAEALQDQAKFYPRIFDLHAQSIHNTCYTR